MTAGITGASITGARSGRPTIDHRATLTKNVAMLSLVLTQRGAPADGIYKAIVEKYPDVGISWFYDEPGCELAGYLPD